MTDEATTASEGSPPKVLVKPVSMILGAVSGLGIAILLQQYAVTLLSWGLMIGMAILGALVFGVGLPTLMLRIYTKKAQEPKEAPQ